MGTKKVMAFSPLLGACQRPNVGQLEPNAAYTASLVCGRRGTWYAETVRNSQRLPSLTVSHVRATPFSSKLPQSRSGTVPSKRRHQDTILQR